MHGGGDSAPDVQTRFPGLVELSSPVRGFRPWRAGRDFVEKLAKPAILRVSPLASASMMVENTALTVASALGLGMDVRAATQAGLVHEGSHSGIGSSQRIRLPTIVRQRIPRDAIPPGVAARMKDVPHGAAKGSPPL